MTYKLHPNCLALIRAYQIMCYYLDIQESIHAFLSIFSLICEFASNFQGFFSFKYLLKAFKLVIESLKNLMLWCSGLWLLMDEVHLTVWKGFCVIPYSADVPTHILISGYYFWGCHFLWATLAFYYKVIESDQTLKDKKALVRHWMKLSSDKEIVVGIMDSFRIFS